MVSGKQGLRVGVLVPTNSTLLEYEFSRMPNDAVEFRFQGFDLPPPNAPEFCEDLLDGMQTSLTGLRQWRADLMLLGCATASMICDGAPWRARLEAMAEAPLITAAEASREAFAVLGLRSLAVATPYGHANNRVVRAFLQASAINVIRLEGMNLDDTAEHWAAAAPLLTVEMMLEYSMLLDSPAADGLYLPCTGVPSVAVVNAYEKQTNKLATSSAQASYWFVLKQLGLVPRCASNGRLLAEF